MKSIIENYTITLDILNYLRKSNMISKLKKRFPDSGYQELCKEEYFKTHPIITIKYSHLALLPI